VLLLLLLLAVLSLPAESAAPSFFFLGCEMSMQKARMKLERKPWKSGAIPCKESLAMVP
jgi:hypothetical protein